MWQLTGTVRGGELLLSESTEAPSLRMAANELTALRQLVAEAEKEFQLTGQLQALETQVLALRRITSHPALALAPLDFRRTARGKLALALLGHFNAVGRIDDVREAVESIQADLDDLPAGSPYRADDLSGLGTLLSTLYEHTGDGVVLGRGIEVLTQAVAEASAGTPGNQDRLLARLGSLHLARYNVSNNRHDLDRCIDAYRHALTLLGADIPDRPGYANELALSLKERYRRTGDVADLDEAIRALGPLPDKLTSSPDPGLFVLSNLGMLLRMRHQHLGSPADLQRAITAYERILAAGDAGDASERVRPFVLTNLGVALMSRYEETGDPADLQFAEEHLEQAVAETPPGSPGHWERLQNLSHVLIERMSSTEAIEDVDRALELLERTRAATPAGPVHPARQEAMLVAVQATRFRLTGAPEASESVLAVGQQALASLPPEEPQRPLLLNDLGRVLLARFGQAGDRADLDRAVEIFELAIDVPSTDWPYRPRQMASLAAALQARHHLTGGSGDLDRAVRLYRVASQHADHGDLRGRLAGAVAWADWAACRRAWEELAEAGSCVLELVVRLARVTLLAGDQAWRKECLILADNVPMLSRSEVPPGNPALDRIDAVLAAQASERSRLSLERLAQDGHGELIERYRAVTGRLRRLERSSLGSPHGTETPDRQEKLAAAWADLAVILGEVRTLDPSIRQDPILGPT